MHCRVGDRVQVDGDRKVKLVGAWKLEDAVVAVELVAPLGPLVIDHRPEVVQVAALEQADEGRHRLESRLG